MGYNIVPINREEHLEGVVSLWKDNFPATFDNRFNWLYEGNPFGPTKTFVAEHKKTGKIAGMGSIYMNLTQIEGGIVRSAVACDFIVDPKYRVFGPALKIERAVGSLVGESGPEFVFAYPNKDSRAIFLRVGYKAVGKSRDYVKLLKTAHKLKKYLKFEVLSKTVGFCLDAAFLLIDSIRFFLAPRDIAFESGKIFDKRFDELWEKAKRNYPISGEKSSAYLNWRYAKCLNQEYRILCLTNKEKNEIKAYAVYYIENKVAIIADLFSDNEGNLHNLILGLSRHLRKYRVNSISIGYMGKTSTDRILKKLLFVQRESHRECMLLLNKDISPEFRNTLFEEENWFVFEGEMDL